MDPYYTPQGSLYSEPFSYAQQPYQSPSYYPQGPPAPPVSHPANPSYGSSQDFSGGFALPVPHVVSSVPPPVYANWGSGYGTNAVNETHSPHPHSHPHPPHSASPASSYSSISSDSSGFSYGSPAPLGYHSSDPQSYAPAPVVAATGYLTESPPPTSYATDSSEDVLGSPIEDLQLGHVPSGHHSHQTISAGAKEGMGHRLWHKISHVTHVTAAFRSTE